MSKVNRAFVIKKDKNNNEITIIVGLRYKLTLDKDFLDKLVYDKVFRIIGYKLPKEVKLHKEDDKASAIIAKAKIMGLQLDMVSIKHNIRNESIYLFNSGDTTNLVIPYSVSYIDLSYSYWHRLIVSRAFKFKSNLKIIGGSGLIHLNGIVPKGIKFKTIDISELDTRNTVFWDYAFWDCGAITIIGFDKLNTNKMKTTKFMFIGANIDKLDLSGLHVPVWVDIKGMIINCECEELKLFKNYHSCKNKELAIIRTDTYRNIMRMVDYKGEYLGGMKQTNHVL